MAGLEEEAVQNVALSIVSRVVALVHVVERVEGTMRCICARAVNMRGTDLGVGPVRTVLYLHVRAIAQNCTLVQTRTTEAYIDGITVRTHMCYLR